MSAPPMVDQRRRREQPDADPQQQPSGICEIEGGDEGRKGAVRVVTLPLLPPSLVVLLPSIVLYLTDHHLHPAVPFRSSACPLSPLRMSLLWRLRACASQRMRILFSASCAMLWSFSARLLVLFLSPLSSMSLTFY